MQRRRSRQLAARTGSALLALLLVPALRADRPLGQIVWTRNAGSEFSVNGYTYVPPGTPRELVRNGVLRVDPRSRFLDDRGTPLKETGRVEAESPRAELRFLHPRLDFTGKRLFFSSGTSWGPDRISSDPKAAPDPATRIDGGALAIHMGLPDAALTDPGAAEGLMDGFPVAGPFGEWLYFARFFYRDVESGPGWYVMRARLEGAAGEEPEFVRDGAGAPLRGSQPLLSPTGRHLFFVRPDPDNVGSDIWYLPLDPLGEQELLVEGEGPYRRPDRGADPTGSNADGTDADSLPVWTTYARMGGKGRIDHPTLSPDTGWIAYACDRDGDWDLYLTELEHGDEGRIRAVGEVPVFPEAVRDPFRPDLPGDASDDMGPSFSGDGRFLAYMSDRRDASPTAAREPGTRIWVVGLPPTGGPDHHAPIEHPSNDADSMWPYWDQDEDPPHVRLTLHPEGGGDPMVLELIDEEPDASTRSDVVSMTLEMRDYHRAVPPPGVPPPPGLEPLRLGRPGGEPHARLEYPVGGGRDNGLYMLLSGKTESLGDHLGMGAFRVPSGRPGKPGDEAFQHRVLTDPGFEGLFLFENVRLKVGVLARDDRWKRVSVPRDLERVLYPGGAVPPPPVEVTHLLPHDPRSLDPHDPKPPYLRRISRVDNQERHFPGITWWVEEMPPGEEVEQVDRVTNENAPYLIFRSPNHPPERYPTAPRLYLRVVVRDLLSNVTDLRIPLHVRPKDFDVNTLQMDQQRGGLR